MEKNEIGGYKSIKRLTSTGNGAAGKPASTEGNSGREVYHFYYAGSLL